MGLMRLVPDRADTRYRRGNLIKVPAIIAANKIIMMVELHEPRDHKFS